jgi:hypothetical protein
MTGGDEVASTSDDKKDYTGAAAALFGNVRIPAALFAGASAGAAFALPLAANEGLKLGVVKRLYALLLVGAFSSQVVAVVVATLTVAALSTRTSNHTTSVQALLAQEYDLEWVSVRLHFLQGALFFLMGIGFRAWISIGCPVIAKAALGLIVSATLLCLAFVQDLDSSSGEGLLEGAWSLPIRYVKLVVQRITEKKRPLFALALTVVTMTSLYIVSKIPHLVHFLSK